VCNGFTECTYIQWTFSTVVWCQYCVENVFIWSRQGWHPLSFHSNFHTLVWLLHCTAEKESWICHYTRTCHDAEALYSAVQSTENNKFCYKPYVPVLSCYCKHISIKICHCLFMYFRYSYGRRILWILLYDVTVSDVPPWDITSWASRLRLSSVLFKDSKNSTLCQHVKHASRICNGSLDDQTI